MLQKLKKLINPQESPERVRDAELENETDLEEEDLTEAETDLEEEDLTEAETEVRAQTEADVSAETETAAEEEEMPAEEILSEEERQLGEMLAGMTAVKALELLKKGLNFDREVERAREEGEIMGRNAKIREVIADSQQTRDDGVPNLGGGGHASACRNGSIFDLARSASF